MYKGRAKVSMSSGGYSALLICCILCCCTSSVSGLYGGRLRISTRVNKKIFQSVSPPLQHRSFSAVCMPLSSSSKPEGNNWNQTTSASFSDSTQSLESLDAHSPIPNEYPPTPTLRDCIKFAVPALGIYVAGSLMSLIDAGFVGRVSSLQLAALGPASAISELFAQLPVFISIATTNLVAKAFATGDNETMTKTTTTAVSLATVIGAALSMGVYFFSTSLSRLYCNGQTTLVPYCASYVRIRALALPAVSASMVAQAALIGVKDATTPMRSVVLAAVVNFIGDLALVAYAGHGVAGAAWATMFSQVCAAALLIRSLLKRNLFQPSALFNSDSPLRTVYSENIKPILTFAPFILVMLMKNLMHNSAAITAASLGGAEAAAHTTIFATAMLCYTAGDVGSSLAQAFLPAFANKKGSIGGMSVWEGDSGFDLKNARPNILKILQTAWCISATVCALASIVVLGFANQLTCDPLVVYNMRRVLPLVLASLSLHATAITLEGLLLAQGAQNQLISVYVIVSLVIAATFRSISKGVFGAGLVPIWSVYVFFQLSRVILFSVVGRPIDIRNTVSRWNGKSKT